MLTHNHPQDSIPAFVLGTLDIDEALLVSAHVIECPDCRTEVEAFQAVLAALPYAAAPRQPPIHVKQQLFARIAAAPAEHARTPSRQLVGSPTRTTPRWMQATTGGALVLSLAFGMMFYNTRSHVALIDNQLAQNQLSLAQINRQHAQDQTAIAQANSQHTQDAQAIAQMQTQIAQAQSATKFIAAPRTLSRSLTGQDPNAHATMYMQPDNPRAIVVIVGMPPVAQGKIYQFWLAKPGIQIPSATFDVTDTGLTVLQITAPAPVNQFDQVMITVEDAGGATFPSDTVVLSGALSAAMPATVPRAD